MNQPSELLRVASRLPGGSSAAAQLDWDQERAVRVFILASVRLYREGLSRCLADARSMSVVGESANPASALDVIQDLGPDIVLLDVGMAHGPPLAREIRRKMARTKVIALAVSDTSTDAISWAGAGISGYITRDQAIEDLVATIERAARGEIVCPQGVVASLLEGLAGQDRENIASPKSRLERLTMREAEILTLIEAGMSNKEIARALSVSLSTIKNHVHSVLRKLEVTRRFDAARQLRLSAARLA